MRPRRCRALPIPVAVAFHATVSTGSNRWVLRSDAAPWSTSTVRIGCCVPRSGVTEACEVARQTERAVEP